MVMCNVLSFCETLFEYMFLIIKHELYTGAYQDKKNQKHQKIYSLKITFTVSIATGIQTLQNIANKGKIKHGNVKI